MKIYHIQQFGIENLALIECEKPQAKANEVLVKFHAASLNYRDLLMVKGEYNPNLKMPVIPLSDGAGEVVKTGENVSRFKIGDRVMPIFMQGWINGELDYSKARTALGGDLDGCLREFGAFNENALVSIPEHLSYEEAATLPCAAVTAFNALFCAAKLKSDETVLLQGTGGVSIFALQFASSFGAKTILTSSSNTKLERAKILGADKLINYKENEDWDKIVLELTNKKGVDHIIEVGGSGTMPKSIKAVKIGGKIAVIGVLSQGEGINSLSILRKAIHLNGIFVGSRRMFEDMNQMISQHKIKPVVDKIFAFEEIAEALKYMESGKHFGKIVIKI